MKGYCFHWRATFWAGVLGGSMALDGGASPAAAAELLRLSPQQPASQMQGKEVDWIYGDYLLQNDQLMVVIAQPLAGRNANMTVRETGAAIIDLTLRDAPNDQLSAYYPAAGGYLFHDPQQVVVGSGDKPAATEDSEWAVRGDSVFWQCTSSSAAEQNGGRATVTYRLRDGDAFVTAEIRIEGDTAPRIRTADGVRADRTFEFDALTLAASGGRASVAVCEDRFFRQTYGFLPAHQGGSVQWGNERLRLLTYTNIDAASNGDGPTSWTVRLYPATSPLDLAAAITAAEDAPVGMQTITLQSPIGTVARALVTVAGEPITDVPNQLYADDEGVVRTRLPSGDYQLTIAAPGYAEATESIRVGGRAAQHHVELPAPARVEAKVTDVNGGSIPAKVTFYATDGREDPSFGPDSAADSVGNCVYSVSGSFVRPIDPGRYDVFVSYGPEYDAVQQTIEVTAGQATPLQVTLKRTVDTAGWVSAELHSHSTPSGDNTSQQRGRVQNLLCEHLEFCPCTEHNRIDSYAEHLDALDAEHLMATCTGMELTGSPLPVNHQNAFPLHHHPHTQDGGGPRTDTNPVVQIERLAMWDDGAEKVVQGNHPHIHQIHGDRDTDGKPDEGFREMFGYMDVIEVHPLESIFQVPQKPLDPRDRGNRIFGWMQLLNHGYRIPGVVNTDAHYNLHGSGWLRNWFHSSTDDPAKIDVADMVHTAEHGHIVMSSGPFLSVRMSGQHQGKSQSALPGDDLICDDGQCSVEIRVQCPNWLDINRVQLLVNGRLVPQHNYTRRSHPQWFHDGTVRFEQTVPLQLESDAHVIVAVIGEGLKLGSVMGKQFGERPPAAVSNPVFVDLQGDGFQPNFDDLGVPLPGADQLKHSH